MPRTLGLIVRLYKALQLGKPTQDVQFSHARNLQVAPRPAEAGKHGRNNRMRVRRELDEVTLSCWYFVAFRPTCYDHSGIPKRRDDRCSELILAQVKSGAGL